MILIALGSNLPGRFGSPEAALDAAKAALEQHNIKILAASRTIRTAPVPASDQPWYHNAVVRVETDMLPRALLNTLHDIEQDFGRVRAVRNEARVIDLDLIAYNDEIINEADLVVPHPRMHERAFVLLPLREIAPRWIHPISKQGVDMMLRKPVPSLGTEPVIMGIVNVTPDSFSDGGQFIEPRQAIDHALQLIEDGAGIIDIGGESTRPGATAISAGEEINRVLPVIEGLKNCNAIISIDTYHAATMRAALAAGAGMINDITALRGDPESLSVAAKSDCYVCLMHMQGDSPHTMQKNPSYTDVVQDVLEFLQQRIAICEAAGINHTRLIADPGIGFGKTASHNFSLLQNVAEFKKCGVPLLIGVSRKSFIDRITPGLKPDQRLAGSISAALWCLSQGVSIFRVHDVMETKQAFAVWKTVQNEASQSATSYERCKTVQGF